LGCRSRGIMTFQANLGSITTLCLKKKKKKSKNCKITFSEVIFIRQSWKQLSSLADSMIFSVEMPKESTATDFWQSSEMHLEKLNNINIQILVGFIFRYNK
jgi:hypothetical protein